MPPRKRKPHGGPVLRQYLVSTPLQVADCRRCGHEVLYGMDSGVPVAIDQRDLTIPEEVQCIAQGRPVFRVVGGEGQGAYANCKDLSQTLIERNQGKRNTPVYPGHACNGRDCSFPNVKVRPRHQQPIRYKLPDPEF